MSTLRLFQGIISNIHSVNPLIYRRLGFLKNPQRGDEDCKTGRCSPRKAFPIEKELSNAFR